MAESVSFHSEAPSAFAPDNLVAAIQRVLDGAFELTDEGIVERWAQQEGASPDTVRAYRAEANRFLAWLGSRECCAKGIEIPCLMLPAVTVDQAASYAEWLASEISPATDLDTIALKRFRVAQMPRRRSLKPSSIVQALALLRALWEYARANTESAVAFGQLNPFIGPLGAKRRQAKPTTDESDSKRTDVQFDGLRARFLNPEAWVWVERALEELKNQPRWRGDRVLRAQLAYALGYYLALRIHEIRLLDGNSLVPPNLSGGRWHIDVIDKGGTLHRMTVQRELEQAIATCRPDVLKPRGQAKDITPLIAPGAGRDGDSDGRVSLSTLSRIFKTVSKLASDLALAAGELDAAQKLGLATAHWCRHARISHLLDDGAPPRLVQRLARHRNISSTLKYDYGDRYDVD